MKIELNYETEFLTEEERLDVRNQLQEILEALDIELGLTPSTQFFFGMPFDFTKMSKKELDSIQRDITPLLACVLMWLEDIPLKFNNSSASFCGKNFNFSKMSSEDLLSIKKDCVNFSQAIIAEKNSRDLS